MEWRQKNKTHKQGWKTASQSPLNVLQISQPNQAQQGNENETALCQRDWQIIHTATFSANKTSNTNYFYN
jgi:hypothetical protein